MTLSLSVVVIGYRNEATIADAVASVTAQNGVEIEAIVVTSGGGGSADIIAAQFPDAALHAVDERWTVAQARNQGVAMANHSHIAFLAGDCVAHPDWAGARLAAHNAGHRVVAGPVTAAPRPIAGLAHALLNYHHRTPNHPAEAVEWPDPRVHSASYERAVFDEVGLFDEARNRGEDSELARRIHAAGIEIWFDPGAVISHQGPASVARLATEEYRRAKTYVEANDLRLRLTGRELVKEVKAAAGKARAAFSTRPPDLGRLMTALLGVHIVIGAATHRAGRLRALARVGDAQPLTSER